MNTQNKLIGGGVLAGAAAAIPAFLVARIFAEPLIQRAIDFEGARSAAEDKLEHAAGAGHTHGGDAEVYSRGIQRTVGLGIGMIAMGLALGALFAVAYVLLRRHYPQVSTRAFALRLAALGFVTIYLVPFLKYPANPPAVGHEDTIRLRSNLYLAIVIVSVVAVIAAAWAQRRLRTRFDGWNSTVIAVAGYAVVVGIAIALLPELGTLSDNVREFGRHATETPTPLRDANGQIVSAGFDADLLYSFRVWAVIAQALFWGGLGLLFGALAHRVQVGDGDTPAPEAPADTRDREPVAS